MYQLSWAVLIAKQNRSAAQIACQVSRTRSASRRKYTELFVFPRDQKMAERGEEYRGIVTSLLLPGCGAHSRIQNSVQMCATFRTFPEISYNGSHNDNVSKLVYRRLTVGYFCPPPSSFTTIFPKNYKLIVAKFSVPPWPYLWHILTKNKNFLSSNRFGCKWRQSEIMFSRFR